MTLVVASIIGSILLIAAAPATTKPLTKTTTTRTTTTTTTTRHAIRPATRPAARAAATTRATDPLFIDAQAAAREKRLPAFASTIEARLREKLRDPAKAEVDEVTRLATLRGLARYFTRVNEPTEGATETLVWLAGQQKL